MPRGSPLIMSTNHHFSPIFLLPMYKSRLAILMSHQLMSVKLTMSHLENQAEAVQGTIRKMGMVQVQLQAHEE